MTKQKDHGTRQLHEHFQVRIGEDGKARVVDSHRLDKLATRKTITSNQRDTGIKYFQLYVDANPTWMKAFDLSREKVCGGSFGNVNISHFGKEDLLRSIIVFMDQQSKADENPYSDLIYDVCVQEMPMQILCTKYRIGSRRMKQLLQHSLSILGKAFDVYS